MLAKENRINTATDFRRVMNKGVRTTSAYVIINVRATKDDSPTRVGFVVSKAVGNAVARNVVKRRLREAAAEFVAKHPTGFEVVARPREGADAATFNELRGEFFKGTNRVAKR
jgi:ribonuclease P protein component